MSQKLINLSQDLKRLREEGYSIEVRGGLLVMRDVPYVNSKCEVQIGTLISSLNVAGEVTQTPETHVVHFDGEFPCGSDGQPLQKIAHQTLHFDFGNGVTAKHSFSSKPVGGYTDYYHKMTTYAAILAGPAEVLKRGVSPRMYRVPEDEENSVFNYTETASDRAGIGALMARLSQERVAVIGLGGTGSYVLDLIAKTPVLEIRTIDGDIFLQHNAFRAPGAPAIEELREAPKKVDYFKRIYSKMHKGIVPHAVALDAGNLHLLDGITFAFLCIDAGEVKKLVVQKLETLDVSFIDVGMGLELVDGTLGGILRVTASTPDKREHVHLGRISFDEDSEANIYSSNIQVADLNAFNAVMAVIKWKKLRGFYRDLECEYHSTYTTDGNMLLNQDH